MLLDETSMRVYLDLTAEQTGIDFNDLGFENRQYMAVFGEPLNFLFTWLVNEIAVVDAPDVSNITLYVFNYKFVNHWRKLCGYNSDNFKRIVKVPYKNKRHKFIFRRWLNRWATDREYGMTIPRNFAKDKQWWF